MAVKITVTKGDRSFRVEADDLHTALEAGDAVNARAGAPEPVRITGVVLPLLAGLAAGCGYAAWRSHRAAQTAFTRSLREVLQGKRHRDRVPPNYLDAIWRNITPVDAENGCAGIGFATSCGPVFLRLSTAQLETVHEVIGEALDQGHRTNSHARNPTPEHADAARTLDDLHKRGRITHADRLVIQRAIKAEPYVAEGGGGPIDAFERFWDVSGHAPLTTGPAQAVQANRVALAEGPPSKRQQATEGSQTPSGARL